MLSRPAVVAAAAAVPAAVAARFGVKRKTYYAAPAAAAAGRPQPLPVAPSLLQRQQAWLANDRLPALGRFSNEQNDKWDRMAQGAPIADPAAAEQRGRAMWDERKALQRATAVVPAEDEEMEEKEQSEGALNDACVASMVAEMERMVLQADEKRSIYTRAQLSCDLLKGTKRCGGDERMDAIRKTLGSLGYTRSRYQKERSREEEGREAHDPELMSFLCFGATALPRPFHPRLPAHVRDMHGNG